ncbi:MAG: AAA family ATPase [Thermoguttaceae bacterium]
MNKAQTLPVIIGFWIKNFRAIKQISFGSSFQQALVIDEEIDLSPYDLTPLTVFIGESGSGKSSILEAFAFLADCLTLGVAEATSIRGGFESIHNYQADGPVCIGVVYRPCVGQPSLTYAVSINRHPSTLAPFVEMEALVYRSDNPEEKAKPVLLFQNGKRQIRQIAPWPGSQNNELKRIQEIDQKHLALAALGDFEDLLDVPQLKRILANFHLSYFTPDNSSGLIPISHKFTKPMRLLNEFKRMEEKHKYELDGILDIIGQRIPNVDKVTYERTEAGRIHLLFHLPGHSRPFYANQISEGTLRLFTNLLLLEDPMPVPLVGMEGPEMYMDLNQMKSLVMQMRRYSLEVGGSQFFITSHQNSFIDYMDPTEVWILNRDSDGNVTTIRALDELVFQGIPLESIGPFWYTDFIYRTINKTPVDS